MRDKEYWELKTWQEEKSGRSDVSGRGNRTGRLLHRTGLLFGVICMAYILAVGAVMEPVYAADYAFQSTTIYAGKTRTAKFTCHGMTGFCCKAGAYSTYRGTASISRMKNTHNAARCAYYYGQCKGWTTGEKAHKLARLLSYCMGNGTGGDYKTSTMKALLKTAKKTPVPSGFECWHCKPKGNSKQDFIVWKYPKGKLKVVKKSSDNALSKLGNYSLEGITIKVYSDAACKKCVKTLKTKSNGKTGGAFNLYAGTYYVKETSVPDKTGYALNSGVFKVKVKAGKTSSVTVANKPAVGSIQIQKEVIGEGGVLQGFRFLLTGKKSGKTYVLVTGPDGTAKVSGLPLGSYTLTEDLNEQQEKEYTDLTGPQTLTIAKGSGKQEITAKRTNQRERQQLKVVKRTGDGGPVSGFSFLISWVLADAGSISAEEIAAAAGPEIVETPEEETEPEAESETEGGESRTLGEWQLEDPEIVKQINADAAAGKTGVYEVALKNTVTTVLPEEAGGKDAARTAQIRIPVTVTLEVPAEEERAAQLSGKSSVLQTQQETETECEGLAFRYSSLRFAGAATSGEETVVTGQNGQATLNNVLPGTYTVTEQMTEAQKKRYREPQAQKIVIEEGKSETEVFRFTNQPIRIPVRLKKSSPDGAVSGMEFTLTGRPDYAEEPMEDITVRTDENGIVDFGMLYPGQYVVEETGFDPASYANTYPMEGKEVPAFGFRITGEELTPEEIEGGKSLWLGGEREHGGAYAEEVSFVNAPYVDLRLTKVDGVTRSFLPGAEFILKDKEGSLAARFRIDRDADGLPQVVMIDSNGVITGESFEAEAENEDPAEDADKGGQEAAGGAVIIGEKDGVPVSVSQSGEEEYQCVLLKGLTEGERYSLSEVRAPEGYTPLEKPYVFTVTLDDSGQPVLNTCDEYGKNIAAGLHRATLVIVNDAPEIGTIATDHDTGDHIAKAGEAVLLTDRCSVTNLTPGEQYTLVARLMDTTEYKASGNVDDVRPVQEGDAAAQEGNTAVMGQKTFEATGNEHIVEVPIQLDGSTLAGRSTVIYESLYQGEVKAQEADQKEPVAEEADPNNRLQSVNFAKIGTTAALPSEDTVVDQVKYEGLIGGRTYLIQGRLMDRSSGEEIEGSLMEVRFQPDEESGTQEVEFQIDPEQLMDSGITELVVFERAFLVSRDEESGQEVLKEIAVHEDLTDEGQTVHLPEGTPPETGDFAKNLWIALMLMTAAAIVLLALQIRKKEGRG